MRRFISRIFLIIVTLVVVVLGATFTAKNSGRVELNYYFGLSAEGSVAVFLLIACGVGVILGFLFSLNLATKNRHRWKQAERRVDHARQELKNLQTLPAADSTQP